MAVVAASVGVLSGLLVVHGRLHLALPGHKALFWMIPLILTRLLTRSKPAVSIGASAACLTTFALGGNLAGGPMAIPLIIVSAALLDCVIATLEAHRTPILLQIPLIGLTAALANLICLIKRLALPAGLVFRGPLFSGDFWFRLACYALFGLLSGLTAATIAHIIARTRRADASPTDEGR